MFTKTLTAIVLSLTAASTIQAAAQQTPAGSPAASAGTPYSAVLNRYCVTCHNEKLKTADLILSQVDVESPSNDAAIWEKVVRKLRARAMPPAGAPRPDDATYASFANYLESELDRAAA